MMTRLKIRLLRRAAWTAALGAVALSATAFAADFPEKPVRVVVGFTAGGPTDIPARLLAEKLGEAYGERFVVENKPGASSMLAAGEVMSQPADGYTILICSYLDPVNPLLFTTAPYKLEDIRGVTPFSEYSYAIAVANDVPADSWEEFVAYARANPGALNYGHLGAGSSQNILAKSLQKAAGIEMTDIPYKGAADALQEIAAGRLHLYFGPPLVVKPHSDAGRVKVLATTGRERISAYPDVPTLVESGTNVEAQAWLGVCMREGTPDAIIADLNEKVIDAVTSDDFTKLIEDSGSKVLTASPEEFDALIAKTATDAAPIIEEFGLEQQ